MPPTSRASVAARASARLALPWLRGSITVAVKTATVAVGPRASCREEPNNA